MVYIDLSELVGWVNSSLDNGVDSSFGKGVAVLGVCRSTFATYSGILYVKFCSVES